MMIIINFLSFLILSIFIATSVKIPFLRWTAIIFMSVFLVLQISSLYLSGSFIDYKFYVHFNLRDMIAMKDFFTLQLFFLFIMLIIFSATIYILKDKVGEIKIYTKKYYRYSIIIILIIVMSLEGGIISNFKDVVKIITVSDMAFEIALKNLGMDNYISPSEVEAKKGKNIILISLESFERGFLSEKKADLTPNMRSLAREWNYYDMKQNPGSGWTSGSLYTTLTGLPSYFKQHMNYIFQESYDTQITGITHILKKAGYQMTYMIGNAKFSATQDLLNAYELTDVIDRTKLSDKYETKGIMWGVHDKDLFEEAKLEILRKKKEKKPFMFFLSTTATHSPDILYDSRMEAFVPPQETKLEFMISAVDYMIGDFINFLKKEDVLSNTIVYIFPDHWQLLNHSVLRGTGARSLYIITNASNDDLKIEPTNTIYQIDLPKLILAGACVTHNVKFFTDYINEDKIQFINNNKTSITALNSSGLKRKNIRTVDFLTKLYNDIVADNSHDNDVRFSKKTKHFDEYAKDINRFIAHAGGRIDGDDYTNSLEALNHNYENGFRLFELDIIETSDGKFVAAHDWLKWASLIDNKVVPIPSEEEFLKHKLIDEYTPLNMERINAWFKDHTDAILVTDKVNEPRRFSKEFIDKKRLMMELFSLDAVKEGIEAGILSAMPSQKVLKELGEDRVSELKSLGVKDLAFSRRSIAKNLDFLTQLKDNGIKVYVFQLNHDEGKDEEYVVNYEMDYIYGLYADEWEFE